MTNPPGAGPDPASDNLEPERSGLSGGAVAAIVIAVVALVAAVVAFFMMRDDGDTTEPSATPSASPTTTASPTAADDEPSATASAEPEPSPSVTPATGSGTTDDPFLQGQTFTYDGAQVAMQTTPSTAVWDIVIESVEGTDVISDEYADYTCHIVTGRMMPVSWPDGQDGPGGADIPPVGLLGTAGDLSTFTPATADGICEVGRIDGREDISTLWETGWPGDEELEFYGAVAVYQETAPPTFVTLGLDDYNATTALYVSAAGGD